MTGNEKAATFMLCMGCMFFMAIAILGDRGPMRVVSSLIAVALFITAQAYAVGAS